MGVGRVGRVVGTKSGAMLRFEHIFRPGRDGLIIARRFIAGKSYVLWPSPVGMAEARIWQGVQPFLRNSPENCHTPSDKSLGYFQLSLWDILESVQTSGGDARHTTN